MRCRVLIGAVGLTVGACGQRWRGKRCVCTEDNRHVRIGDEKDVVSGDGLLMPVRKGRPAPHSRHFEQARK